MVVTSNWDGSQSPEVHPTIAKKLLLAGHQRRGAFYTLVEVQHVWVDRGRFHLVILVPLGAPRLVQLACLVYEFVRPWSIQMLEKGVLVEELLLLAGRAVYLLPED
jgi:hypothetical protein